MTEIFSVCQNKKLACGKLILNGELNMWQRINKKIMTGYSAYAKINRAHMTNQYNRGVSIWQLMNKNVMTNGSGDDAFFELEYGAENEGLRVTITVPKPMQDFNFAKSINDKIDALKILTFANQPERFNDPIKQGFDIALISPPQDNPNSESKEILSRSKTSTPKNLCSM